jgi:hypothetical protein
MPTPADSDICRFDDALTTYIHASLVDWQAFYLYRALARWREEEYHRHRAEVRYWLPSNGTWDQLEQRLFARWGSAPGRWWDRGPHVLPRYACLVCRDTGRVRWGACPGCHPPPPQPPKPRKRDWVALDQPQLFG